MTPRTGDQNRLGVLLPNLGKPSETFIRRHIEEILPNKSTVVTLKSHNGHSSNWDTKAPIFAAFERRKWRNMPLGTELLFRLHKRIGFMSGDLNARAAKFLHHHKVNIVLSQYLDFSLRFLPLKEKYGFRFFAHAHGYDVSSAYRDKSKWEKMRQLEVVDGIIVVNQVMKRRLQELGIPSEKITIIPYGVDVPEEYPGFRDANSLQFISVGRMVPKKAPQLLIRGFAGAANSHPTALLHYIGDGSLLEGAKAAAREMGIENRVYFHGAKPHSFVLQMYRQCDALLQHSIIAPDGDEEGVPVAILEALAHGLPVVATRHAGIPEAVNEGETGFLVDEGDTSGMADRIVQLAADASLREQMSRNAWADARRRFRWQREIEELRRFMSISVD